MLAARAGEGEPDRAERADGEDGADDRDGDRAAPTVRREGEELAGRASSEMMSEVGHGERGAEGRDRTGAQGRRAHAARLEHEHDVQPDEDQDRRRRRLDSLGERPRAVWTRPWPSSTAKPRTTPAGIANAKTSAQEAAARARSGRGGASARAKAGMPDREGGRERELAGQERVGAAADADGQDEDGGEDRLGDEQLGDALDVARGSCGPRRSRRGSPRS